MTIFKKAKKTITKYFKRIVEGIKYAVLCRNKTEVECYDQIIDYDAFLAKGGNLDALKKVMELCKDKTDVERYERLIDDDAFLAQEENIIALRQVIVTDTSLWGGDLRFAFLPTEYDDEFVYGWGVEAAYRAVMNFLPCGIRESNPAISWIRHFFAKRDSQNQKIDGYCLSALEKSLMPLCNKEDIEQFYEAAEAVNEIPCEAWGDFVKGFYPFYDDWALEYDLEDILKS